MMLLASSLCSSFVGRPVPRMLAVMRTARGPPTFMAVESEAAGKTAVDAEELCGVLPDNVCEQIYEDADAVFSVIDVNGDGSVSMDELTSHLMKSGYNEAAVQKVFEKLDTDKDGELSKEELRAGFLQYSPLREAPGLGSYNSRFVLEIHEDADALFNAIDADGNGSISKDELREHLKTFSQYSFKAISKIFKVLDVNRDGAIEKSELRDAFVKYSA